MIIATLADHDRQSFSCGAHELDSWLKKQAGKDARRGYASVFVASPDDDPKRIIGFYALSAASISLSRLSLEEAKKLPRYPDIPAVRLGRLAVDQAFQGKNIGKLLLMDAIRRATASEVAWAIFLVEAKNAKARAFYKRFYFSSFFDNDLAMWLKRKQAERIAAILR